MKTLETAIIGYGRQGATLAETIRRYVPELRVTAAIDAEGGRIGAAVKDGLMGYRAGLLDEDQFYKHHRPDVVVIATNPPFHCEQVVQAARYGCHIVCEKPLALSPEEADRMVAAVRDANVTCAVNFGTIFADPFRVFESYLRCSDFGRLIRFEVMDKGRPPSYDLEESAVHFLHALPRLIGAPPVECFAWIITDGRPANRGDIAPMAWIYPQGRHHDRGLKADMIAATYRFENGVIADLRLAKFDDDEVAAATKCNVPGSEFMKMIAEGTKAQLKFHQEGTGSVYLKRTPGDKLDEMHWRPIEPLWTYDSTWGEATGRLIQDFVWAIETGRDPISNIEDARLAGDMIYVTYASHFSGQPLKLPLKDRRHPLHA